MSYSRQDAAQVDLLAAQLAQGAGLSVWLDRERTEPGTSWRSTIETVMNESSAVLIIWGPRGLGRIQRQERDLAYVIRDGNPDFRVIYVFLPNTPEPQGNWANVDTWIRFESSLDEPDIVDQLVAAIKGEAITRVTDAELPNEPAPYRGLSAFAVENARFYFGRSASIQEMFECLSYHPFLAILGPSGSGKTSLVQAGFLSALQKNGAVRKKKFHWVVVRPGKNPIRALAMSLAQFKQEKDPLEIFDNFLERLQSDVDELIEIIQSLKSPENGLVLVVDQVEELFTLCESEEERVSFINSIVKLIEHPHQPTWVVTTMRADFYGHVGRYPKLAKQLVNHQLYIETLGEEEIAEVIEAPATQVGAIFEKGLSAQVLNDAQVKSEVVLPLLQHTLDLLWRNRRGRWLLGIPTEK